MKNSSALTVILLVYLVKLSTFFALLGGRCLAMAIILPRAIRGRKQDAFCHCLAKSSAEALPSRQSKVPRLCVSMVAYLLVISHAHLSSTVDESLAENSRLLSVSPIRSLSESSS